MFDTNGVPVIRIRVIDIFNHNMMSDKYNDNFILYFKGALIKMCLSGKTKKSRPLMELMIKNIPDKRKTIKNELTITSDIDTALDFVVNFYELVNRKDEKLDGKNMSDKIDRLAVSICLKSALMKFVIVLMEVKAEAPSLQFNMQDLEFMRQILEAGLKATKNLVDSWYIYHDSVPDSDKALDIFSVKEIDGSKLPPDERVKENEQQ